MRWRFKAVKNPTTLEATHIHTPIGPKAAPGTRGRATFVKAKKITPSQQNVTLVAESEEIARDVNQRRLVALQKESAARENIS